MINVSVIIPAYNASATLAETVESLLAQTYPKWEAIIVDDGSDDGTLEILAAHPKVEIRHMPEERDSWAELDWERDRTRYEERKQARRDTMLAGLPAVVSAEL